MTDELPSRDIPRNQVYFRIKEIIDTHRGEADPLNAVYVLRCSRFESKENTIRRAKSMYDSFMISPDNSSKPSASFRPSSLKEASNAASELETEQSSSLVEYPSWIELAYEVDELFYVGWSNRIYKRITDHVVGANDAALFTKLFPPKKIEDIHWFNTVSEARRAEPEIAMEITQYGKRPPGDMYSRDDISIDELLSSIKEFDDEYEVSKYAYFG